MPHVLLQSAVASDAAPTVLGRSVCVNLVRSMRSGQWSKNLLLFAGLLFSRHLLNAASLERAVAAFAIFCALSSCVYLINDVTDRHRDRRHPRKCRRPIASGALSVPSAVGAAAALGVTGLGASVILGWSFCIVAVSYLGLLTLYSVTLKHILIVDVLTIALGFVLRAVAGAVAVDVEISHWLLVCTLLLALFIALAKRRHEFVLLASDATSHRRILEEYSPYLLDQMIAVATASTLLTYTFYAISQETVQKFGTDRLLFTIPFPLYGIFRYLYLVHRRDGGGNPSELLLTDLPLLSCVGLWGFAAIMILYGPWR